MKLLLIVLAFRFVIVVIQSLIKNKKEVNEEVNSNWVKHPAEFQLRW